MTMPDLPPASLRLRINTAALWANWRALDAMSGAARAGAAVKADAYGLGIANVIPALSKAGARDFFVAHWSEVPAVLDHVNAAQVSVLHGTNSAAEAQFAIASGVTPVINSLHQASVWVQAGGGACHLMVDSGINRLGISTGEVGDPAVAALNVQTLMSHLASADEDVAKNAAQLALFRDAAQAVPHKQLSLANSAGIALGPDYAFDLTRPGLSLYGGVPRPELASLIKQVAHLEAAIIQRRRLSAGDDVGYNAIFTAPRDMEVATVSAGYADGFLRCRGIGSALHNAAHNLPIIGRVSMDMIVVDCSAAPELREGDFLQIPFDLSEVSHSSGLSQYELLTTLGKRFARTT